MWIWSSGVIPIHQEPANWANSDSGLGYSCLSKFVLRVWLTEHLGFGVWIWERELWERDLGVGLLLAPCFWCWRIHPAQRIVQVNSQNMVFLIFFFLLLLTCRVLLAQFGKRSFCVLNVAGMPVLVGFAYGLSFLFFLFQHEEMNYWWERERICWKNRKSEK